VLRALEDLVDRRRQLDLEYSLHRLGRLWLLAHGPASALLLALVLDHVLMSAWYGGY